VCFQSVYCCCAAEFSGVMVLHLLHSGASLFLPLGSDLSPYVPAALWFGLNVLCFLIQIYNLCLSWQFVFVTCWFCFLHIWCFNCYCITYIWIYMLYSSTTSDKIGENGKLIFNIERFPFQCMFCFYMHLCLICSPKENYRDVLSTLSGQI
jgi:hypothetical protein